jgi:hypothetical protein
MVRVLWNRRSFAFFSADSQLACGPAANSRRFRRSALIKIKTFAVVNGPGNRAGPEFWKENNK